MLLLILLYIGKREFYMDINLLFKIAAVGILVAVLHQVLVRAGREDQAMMTTLAGLVIVLTAIPGILSLIGLPLGCFCRKGGPKIVGIILNTIALAICVIQVVLIFNI